MGVTIATTRVASNTSTGNQTISTADLGGLTPKAVILIATRGVTDGTAADGAGWYMGMSDGTNELTQTYEAEHAQASMDTKHDQDTTANRIMTIYDGTADGVVVATADWVSFQADGVTIDWTDAPPSAFLITAIFFAGTDLSTNVGSVSLGNTADALVAVTSVGFEADVLITMMLEGTTTQQGHVGLGVVHNDRAGTVTQRAVSHSNRNGFSSSWSAAVMHEASCLIKLQTGGSTDFHGAAETFDSSGFDIQLGNARAPANNHLGWLALRFGSTAVVSSKVYTYSTPTATGSNTDAGAGFEPQFVMYLATRTQTAGTVETDADGGALGLVVVDADDLYTNSLGDEDAAADSNTQSLSDDKLNLPTHTGAAGQEATFTSFGGTGVTWNWSTVDGTARQWAGLAIEKSVSTITGTSSITLADVTLSSSGTVAVNGTSSPTLANVTLSASGTVSIDGSSTPTLENITSSATGDIGINGSSTPTLENITSSATGAVDVDGDLSTTLGDVTLSSTGTVENAPITGDANITLSGVTVSASGVVAIDGTLSKTLDNVTLSSSGTLPVTGTSSITLDATTLSASGTVAVSGTSAITLGDLTLSSSGNVDLVGSSSITLGNVTSTATGNVNVSGTSSITLDNISLSGTGVVNVGGTASITLDNVTISSSGVVSIEGTSSITLDNVTLSGSGTLPVTGTSSITLDDVTLSANGVIGNPPITGDASITFGNITVSSSGAVAIDGTSSMTLGNTTLSSSGSVDVVGSSSITFGNITLSASGTVVTTTLEQEGFRWRLDDGSEITATWKESQDVTTSLQRDITARLRFLINSEGVSGSKDFQLEVSKRTGVSPDTWDDWKKVNS